MLLSDSKRFDKEVKMNTPQNKSSSLAAMIRYLPRILCILAILFVSMFALDAFSPGISFWRQIARFLMHMIPSFVLIIVLIIAWKHELTGGILLALIGLAASPFVYSINYNRLHSVWKSVQVIALITVPFIIIGALFIVSYYLHRTKKLTA